MNERYLFGIGMVLVVLLAFTAPAAAGNTAYFVPQHSNATTGNSTYVTLYVDIDEGTHFAGGHVQLQFDPAHANITRFDKMCNQADNRCWATLNKNLDYIDNGYFWGGCSVPQYWDSEAGEWTMIEEGYFTGPATVKIGRFKVGATGTPGESPFDFGFEVYPEGCSLCLPCKWSNETGVPFDVTWVNGTFTHLGGPAEPFSKSLPAGWNLISLPLTPLDNSVGVVLDGVSRDAVKQYDATTKTFETATTMAPGTGYFVHVTTAGDWTYEGTSVSSTSPGLKAGLNMIGVPNCTMSVGAAMGTADYRYVARWNADDQKYEVYNPSAPEAFYGFTEMTAGEGYFVSAKSDDVDWTVSCP
jgi:hypothetical protein